MWRIPLLCLVCWGASLSVNAQLLARRPSDSPVLQQDKQNISLQEALNSLTAKYNIRFGYKSTLIDGHFIRNTEWMSAKTLDKALHSLLIPFDLTYKRLDKTTYVIKERKETTPPAEKIEGSSHTQDSLQRGQTSALAIHAAQAAFSVTGLVTDENGQGIPGVSVLLKGTTIGVATDASGKYALTLPDGTGILVFSFIGYTTKEKSVGDQSVINIQLVPDITTLSEVVVVGYGEQKRQNVSASIATVGKVELENRPTTNAYQALQGLAGNVTIQQNDAQPGAVPVFNIRGVGSFSSNNEPLIIIDGLNAGSLGMANLNPNDIESISVLKDASSAAIYGSQAGNGVVVITTKRGKTDQKPTLRYSGLFGIQNPTTLPEAVEGWEFMTLKNEALVNSNLAPQYTPDQIAAQREKGSYPWMYEEQLRKNTPQIKHDLTLSGGGKNTNYLASFGYLNQQNMLSNKYVQDAGDDFYYKRYNARLNIGTKISDILRVDVNAAYAKAYNRNTPFSMGNLMRDALRTPRIYPLVNEDGTFPTTASFTNNNLALLSEGGFRLLDSDNLVGNFDATLTPLKGLRFNMNISGNYFQYNQETQIRKFTYHSPYPSDPPRNNELTKESWRDYNTNAYFTGEYEREFGRHTGKIMAGYRSDYFSNNDKLGAYRFGTVPLTSTLFLQGDFQRDGDKILRNIDDYSKYSNPQEAVLNSVFGRFNYNFADKYLFEFTWRYDGSSKLAPENRWLLYPAASVAWRITNEPFMQAVKNRIGEVKLRASHGKVGNSGIGGYLFIPRIELTNGAYTFNNVSVGGANIKSYNPDLRWASVTSTNLGIDVSLFQNKIEASFDYFHSLNNDIYYEPVVPGTFGQTSPTQNYASVLNRGWELAVAYRLNTGAVNHYFSANLADNFNTIEKIGEPLVNSGDYNYIMKEDFPISSYYMLKSDGLFQTTEQIQNAAKQPFAFNGQPQPGDIKYVDKNGDGVIDANDRFIVGNPFPRYTFGFTYRANYKGFDFTVFLQGVGKRYQYLRGDIVEAFHNNEEHLFTQHKDRWTPTNPDAGFPRLTASVAANANNVSQSAVSDYWLYDTKYLRVKNIQLGYNIPTALLSKVKMTAARIYLSGQNLLTFVPERFRKVGMDPEFTQFNNRLASDDNSYSPVAGRSYPNSKVWAAGIDISF
jgi:TonB-linked SusC/RagA family outer membrane protein